MLTSVSWCSVAVRLLQHHRCCLELCRNNVEVVKWSATIVGRWGGGGSLQSCYYLEYIKNHEFRRWSRGFRNRKSPGIGAFNCSTYSVKRSRRGSDFSITQIRCNHYFLFVKISFPFQIFQTLTSFYDEASHVLAIPSISRRNLQ